MVNQVLGKVDPLIWKGVGNWHLFFYLSFDER